ncbi:MAG: zinc ribbon domain-containing protein [Candidatus Helarchaeota archaeon]
MKVGLIIAGGIVLFIGFALFLFGFIVVQQYSTSLAQLGLLFSAEARRSLEYAILMEYGGGFVAILGFILLIYGAVAKREGAPVTTYTQGKIFCSYCGTENSTDAVYCKNCGKRLR